MIRFSMQLTEEEICDLVDGDEVLVVDLNNGYTPFIGKVSKNDSKMRPCVKLIIKDIAIPEDFVWTDDENTKIFKVE